MQYNILGRTGLKVSAVSFGGIPIQRIDAAASDLVLQQALDTGINFFDTARAYTDSEQKMGRILSKQRDKCLIATKSMARTKEAMAADIDLSLQQLQTDHIDLYQMHNVKDEKTIQQIYNGDGALAALLEAKKAGKIGFIGITGHVPEFIKQALQSNAFDTVQYPYNYVEDRSHNILQPVIDQLQLGSIIMKPLAGGALRDGTPALKYLLASGVDTVIPGMDFPEQVRDNAAIGAMSSWQLSVAEQEQLQAAKESLAANFCRRCEYCKPCPQGIDIPTVFLLEGYFSRYNMPDWARKRYDGMAVKASSCIKCGVCETRCPYNLPIREMLQQYTVHFENC